MKEAFHQRVKRLREAKGWSPSKLSKRSELSETLITEIEFNPNHVPAWLTIVKLASALHINPYYLATGDGDDKPFKVMHDDFDAISLSSKP